MNLYFLNNKTVLLNLTILLLVVILTFLISLYAQVPGEKDIFGVWRGEHNGSELLFRFNSDGTCILRFKDNASGSVEMLNGNFEMDFSKKPSPLTIRNIPQLDHPLHTIIQFRGDGVMRIAPFAARWRLCPISFDPNVTMNLKRVASIREKIRRLP